MDCSLTSTSYGKTGVKLLFVKRGDSSDDITEFEVSTLLQLYDVRDYERGDNSLVIPTDTQKNLVYIIAQKYGVSCPEEFAKNLSNHFLSEYPQVLSATVCVQTQHGWRRMVREGKEHSHAFISSPECNRTAKVFHKRGGGPVVSAGISGLRVLKTTKSAFVGFHQCDATTLKDAKDRILSTVIEAEWTYSTTYGLDYCQAWSTVMDCILEKFAGPPDVGISSPSVQLTIYDTEKLALARVRHMREMSMTLPNVHYFDVDMDRFKDRTVNNTKNVYLPTVKPYGLIKATLSRSQMSKL